METQFRHMTRDELHKMIDEIPEEELMVLTYRTDIGISDNGKKIKKRKIKIFIDRAKVFILTTKPVKKVDLEGDFSKLKKKNIIKTILFP